MVAILLGNNNVDSRHLDVMVSMNGRNPLVETNAYKRRPLAQVLHTVWVQLLSRCHKHPHVALSPKKEVGLRRIPSRFFSRWLVLSQESYRCECATGNEDETMPRVAIPIHSQLCCRNSYEAPSSIASGFASQRYSKNVYYDYCRHRLTNSKNVYQDDKYEGYRALRGRTSE
jgi:hypothetical protein